MVDQVAAQTAVPAGALVAGDVRVDAWDARDLCGWLGRGSHPAWGRVELRALAPSLGDEARAVRWLLDEFVGFDSPSVQTLLTIDWDAPLVVFVYRNEPGLPLSEAVAAWTQAGHNSFRFVYNLLGHLIHSLAQLHAIGPHGALLPEFVRLRADGTLVVTALGLSRLVLGSGLGRRLREQSAYVAPELRQDPDRVSESSDWYALGVLGLHVLTGQEPTVHNVGYLVEELGDDFAPVVEGLWSDLLASEPGLRATSPPELMQRLREALEETRALGRSGEARKDILGEKLAEELGVRAEDLPDLEDERWVVHKSGRDYGPYTAEEVRRQFVADEIDEYTPVRDAWGDLSGPLGRVAVFADFVEAELPARDERRHQAREEVERRRDLVRRSGRGTLTGVFVAAPVALLVIIGAFSALFGDLFWSHPAPYEFSSLSRTFRYQFDLEQPQYEAMAVDPALLARLLREETGATDSPRRPARRPASAPRPIEEPEDDDAGVAQIDASRPFFRLSQAQVNEAVGAQSDALYGCFLDERRSNPAFRGATLTFSIQSNGRTFGIRVQGQQVSSTLRSCAVRAVRSLRFPTFNDLPMNISFPIRLEER